MIKYIFREMFVGNYESTMGYVPFLNVFEEMRPNGPIPQDDIWQQSTALRRDRDMRVSLYCPPVTIITIKQTIAQRHDASDPQRTEINCIEDSLESSESGRRE